MSSKLVLSAICTVMRFRRPLLRETLSTHMLLRLMLGTCVGLFEPIFWKTKQQRNLLHGHLVAVDYHAVAHVKGVLHKNDENARA